MQTITLLIRASSLLGARSIAGDLRHQSCISRIFCSAKNRLGAGRDPIVACHRQGRVLMSSAKSPRQELRISAVSGNLDDAQSGLPVRQLKFENPSVYVLRKKN